MNVQLNHVRARRHFVMAKGHVSSLTWTTTGSTVTQSEELIHRFGTARRLGGSQR
jgi:hypothetical protein